MIKYDNIYVDTLRNILDKINYKIIIKNIIPNKSSNSLEYLDIDNKNILKLLFLGESLALTSLLKYLDKKEYEILLECSFLINKKDIISTNNLIIYVYNDLYIISEINHTSKTCQNKSPEIYLGPDSFELAKNIEFKKNSTVLDLCSGTGIQGMIAAKFASNVISVEINENARKILNFNVKLNKLQNVIKIYSGNLYSEIKNKKFDYIYVNPPFLPIPKDIDFPLCGAGGNDGLEIINKILKDLPNKLN